MATIQGLHEAQQAMESSLLKRMADFESQLSCTPPENISHISKAFSVFKEFVCSMFKYFQQQITELQKSVDHIEMKHRRKSVLFSGIPETKADDNINEQIVSLCNSKLGLSNIELNSISECYRLGKPAPDKSRSVVVKFASMLTKSQVWKKKAMLKGSSIVMSEFLTKSRQSLFVTARKHFGMSNVWTLEGNITIKLPDGSRHRVFSVPELEELVSQHGSSANMTKTPVIEVRTDSSSKAGITRPKRAAKKN